MTKNLVWTEKSLSAEESMPLGGNGLGLNVWFEDDSLLIYFQRSGTMDENNGFPKLGRIRLQSHDKSWNNITNFRQELDTQTCEINLSFIDEKQRKNEIKIWVNAFKPVFHMETKSSDDIRLLATYENWRYQDKLSPRNNRDTYIFTERNDIFGMWLYPKDLTRYRDDMDFNQKQNVVWFHENRNHDLAFDKEMDIAGFKDYKEDLFNPVKDLIYGGCMYADNMNAHGTTLDSYLGTPFKGYQILSVSPRKNQRIDIYCHQAQVKNPDLWLKGLYKFIQDYQAENYHEEHQKTHQWWADFWQRSWIEITPKTQNPQENDEINQVSTNYKLFRFMQGFNNNATFPLKFNGGLHTYDSCLVKNVENDRNIAFIQARQQQIAADLKQNTTQVAANENVQVIRDFGPDYRAWGGATLTLQNQRLLYWPLLKSGDIDLCKPQFDWFKNALKTAELRTQIAWGHKGCSFTEQVNTYGIPIGSHFGWEREDSNMGLGEQISRSCDVHYSTQLEFAYMILEAYEYSGEDISPYLDFIISVGSFVFAHYEYEAKKAHRPAYDDQGYLIIYPSTALESYKDAKNPCDTTSALRRIYEYLLRLDNISASQRVLFETLQAKIPPLTTRKNKGHETISPAYEWTEINNVELPQMYPVYPYQEFGVGLPNLSLAINTWKYSCNEKYGQRSYVSWHQDGIFTAHLGLLEESTQTLIGKLANGGRKFPAFWGPGHDWTPDFNWGGTGQIQLQEMLLQTKNNRLLLLPCWNKNWDVKFKLHAPHQTTIECEFKNGKVETLIVTPKERTKDIELMLK